MTDWSDIMPSNLEVKNRHVTGSGYILPKTGKTGQWYLGAALLYVGLGAPGSKTVVRELAAIIDRPQYLAKMASIGVGGFLVLNASG